jgi:sRNA-binding carbon storage regulator CsrA
MVVLTCKPAESIRIGASAEVAVAAIRGDSVQLGSSVASEIPTCQEEALKPSRPIEAGKQREQDVARLIEDGLSGGRPLHEIEDHLDWLENNS